MTRDDAERRRPFSRADAEVLLADLIRHYSPSGAEGQAVRFLVNEMASLGFRAYVDGAGNAVGELGSGPRTLLLLGHIDTVPGEIAVRRDGRQLYGRGSVDAKGPLAAFVAAAAIAGPMPGKRTVVVGAVEEEAATSKGARFLLAGPAPAAVVVGEPSAWDGLTVGYKGRLLLDYALSRPVGHTAGPAQSACEEAVAFWQQVVAHADAYNADQERMFDQLAPTLRAIHTDSDGLVEQVRMAVGFRLPPAIDVDRLQDALVAHAGDAVLRFHGREIAYRASRGSRLARLFVRAIQAQGGRAHYKVKSGTSDMNVVGPVWGCPILAYGPGDAALDHTPDEHIDLDGYHRAIAVLTEVLTAF
ncbi:MAG: [LysW]-lysine hydrolase [Anaerolineae bacterium]|nr:[LysW]-lysine hydrolase [Anaerolineae bacterium]